MGFFNLRAKTLTDDELRDTLFDAATGSNAQDLKKLLKSYMPRVIALFPTWTTLPPSVRSDPSRMKWWAEGMIGTVMAKDYCERIGDQEGTETYARNLSMIDAV